MSILDITRQASARQGMSRERYFDLLEKDINKFDSALVRYHQFANRFEHDTKLPPYFSSKQASRNGNETGADGGTKSLANIIRSFSDSSIRSDASSRVGGGGYHDEITVRGIYHCGVGNFGNDSTAAGAVAEVPCSRHPAYSGPQAESHRARPPHRGRQARPHRPVAKGFGQI